MASRTSASAERMARAVLLLAVLLSACRTAPDGVGHGYFPMAAGMRWVYEVRTTAGTYELEVTAQGERSLSGWPGPVFVMDETTRGSSAGFVETSPVAYVVQEGYVARITAVDYADSGDLRRLGDDEPTRILPLDAQPGQRWSQQTTLFQTPDGEGAFMGWSAEVKPHTSLQVPAGRFDAVLVIESVYRNRAGEEAPPQAVYRDSYAPGVGLVRSVSEHPADSTAGRVEQVLLEVQRPRR